MKLGRPPYEPDYADPATWRAPFQLQPRAAAPDADFRARAACRFREPLHARDTLGLAFRLEAIIRVLRNPDLYARRLQRRLNALAARAEDQGAFIGGLLAREAMPLNDGEMRPVAMDCLEDSQTEARWAASLFAPSG